MFLLNGQSTTVGLLTERGLHYGDGLFETIPVIQQRPLLWSEHRERLSQGCQRLHLANPPLDLIEQEVRQLLATTQHKPHVLKIILTSGTSGRGYQRSKPLQMSRCIGLYAWPDRSHCAPYDLAYHYQPDFPGFGVTTQVCHMRLSHNSALAGIKHLNRLEQVLAANEICTPSIAEGIMLDTQDQLISGIASNLFIVKNQVLLTPALQECGIAGIMRKLILRLALQEGIPVVIKPLGRQDLIAADEAFLSSSLIGIWPISQCDDFMYSKGHLTHHLLRKVRLFLEL